MFYLMKKNAVIGSIIIISASMGVNILFATLSSSDWLHLPLVMVNHKKEAFILLYRLCVSRYLCIFPLVFLLMEQKLKYGVILFLSFIGAGYIY